jgi:hypothetical protein
MNRLVEEPVVTESRGDGGTTEKADDNAINPATRRSILRTREVIIKKSERFEPEFVS